MPRNKRNFPGTGKKAKSIVPFKSASHKAASGALTKAKKLVKKVSKETGKNVTLDDYNKARRRYKNT